MSNFKNITSSIAELVGSDIDSSVIDVFEKLQLLIDKLKSNVKWLYQYGGNGSGGGNNTGGDTSTWKLNASLAGQTLTDGATITLGESGSYILSFSITRHGGAYFSYVVKRQGVAIKGLSGNFSADDDKDYTLDTTIDCSNNSTLSIEVKDEDANKQVISINYITDQFIPSISLVDNNNNIISATEILADTYKSNGLYLRFTYTAPVDTLIIYEFTDFNNEIYTLFDSNGDTYEAVNTSTEIFKKPVSTLTDLTPDTYYIKFKYKVYYKGSCIMNKWDTPITYTMSIIPNTLFLKIVSNSLTLSKVELTDSTDIIGMKSITITPFEGASGTDKYDCSYSVYCANTNITTTNNLSLTERTSAIINLNCSSIGSYKVTFNIVNTKSVTDTYTTSVYFYIIEGETNFIYYPEYSETVLNYYRSAGNYTSAFSSEGNNIYIEQTGSNENKVYNLESDSAGSMDLLFEIGIQYNIVNEDSKPICKLYGSTATADSGSITIYPNKIYFGSESNTTYTNIYIPKLEIASPTTLSNYHMITVYKRLIEVIDLFTYYYEFVVYIDGILEGGLENFIDDSTRYDRLILYPGNYYINFIEATTFKSFDQQTASASGKSLSDAEIVQNYYTYLYLLQNNAEIVDSASLLNYLTSTHYSYDVTTSLVKVDNYDTVKTVSGLLNIPTLYCKVLKYTKYTDDNGLTFIDWMLASYGSEDTYKKDYDENERSNGTIDTAVINSLQYMAAGDNTFKTYNITTGEWTLDIQGSSTRQNKTPNFTLSINPKDEENTTVPVFTPNFDINNTNSFLPEASFYLKADIADSAHSNNTATGKFVNENTTSFLSNLEGILSGHIKLCLDGFPVLVYVEIEDPTTSSTTSISGSDNAEIYFLGVFNFNLGRGSNYNLGYKDYSVFLDTETNKLRTDIDGLTGDGTFQIMELTKDEFNKSKYNLTVAEILSKKEFFDFSQYDTTVLFKLDDNDSTYMYGDIVSTADEVTKENHPTTLLLNFTKSISKIGGFIFTELGKSFGDLSEAYHGLDSHGNFKNQVPDYTKLYMRDNRSYDTYYENGEKVIPYNTADGIIALTLLINGDGANYGPVLDYDSAVEYYVICMAFGLVDSVQKNLNLKSWKEQTINGEKHGQFHVAFYDMDTGYGINNLGNETSYVCFSDYWYTPDSDGSTIPVSTSFNTVYRDFYPDEDHAKEIGYDVPSNYLFAIAKYAGCFISVSKTPQLLWANWRKSTGPLRSADYFIETYYKLGLSAVPEQLFNLNYRAKYFGKETSSVNEDGTAINTHAFHGHDFEQFGGRKLNKVRDWLNNRFHILDAYFMLDAQETLIIYKLTYDTNGDVELTENGDLNWVTTNYYLSKPTVLTQSDMQYLINIFTGSNSTSASLYNAKACNTTIELKALDYTPIMYKVGEANGHRYMLNDSTKTYQIPYSVASSSTTVYFFGSYYITNIGNISPFILMSDIFALYSLYALNIYGDSGTIKTFNINYGPSLKNITLTSKNYSGLLTLTNASNTSTSVNFPLLSYIDISNSAITLTCNNIPIKTLNISNIKSSKIDIENCNYITNLITYTNDGDIIKCDDLTITPINCSNITFNELQIGSLSLKAGVDNASVSILNDEAMTEVSLIDYETITISNCPKLTSINISGDKVKKVVISECNASILDLNAAQNISYVDVHNNSRLSTLIMNPKTETVLTYLNISDTIISTLYWSSTADESAKTGTIDLTNATALAESGTTSFICKNNTGVEYIYFANKGTSGTYLKDNFDKAVRIGSFLGCTNLKRIYGNVIVTDGNYTFAGCHSFSIHGMFIGDVIFYGKPAQCTDKQSDLYGNVFMPYQLLADDIDVEPQSYYFNGGEEPMDVKFQEGSRVTNMSFDITNFNYTFDATATTLFDIYYVFSNANPVSSYKNGKFDGTALTFNNTFSNYELSGLFTSILGLNKFNGFRISKYMLHNVAKFSTIFSPFESLTFNYYNPYPSPTIDPVTGECTKDDGWYSPLWDILTLFPNLTLGTSNTSSVKYLIDENFFRHTNDDTKTCPLKTINGFLVLLYNDIVDSTTTAVLYDASDENKQDINTTNYIDMLDIYGNFGHLFTKLRNLSNITRLYTFMLDFSTVYVPDGVTSLNYAFKTTFGIGRLDLTTAFSNKSALTEINNGTFSTSYTPTNNPANMVFTNETFKNFSNLVLLGSSSTVTSTYDPIFNITKYVDPDNFPYDMFNPEVGCPNSANIESMISLFANLKPLPTSAAIGTAVQLPYTLFNYTTNIKNLYRCFYNLNINFELTSESFSNCNSLSIVSYLFARDKFYTNDMYLNDTKNSSYNEISYMQGSIPYKFLYHGDKTATEPLTNITKMEYLFAGQDIECYTNENPNSIWDYDGVHGRDEKDDRNMIDTTLIININDTSNIKLKGKMVDLTLVVGETYDITNESGYTITVENKEISDTITIIWNENLTITFSKVDETSINKTLSVVCPYTFSYYDDIHYPESYEDDKELMEGYKYIRIYKETLNEYTEYVLTGSNVGYITNIGNFCCPPDLFRYCNNTENLSVTGVFNNCGSAHGALLTITNNTTNYGLKGRIPPYLFMPISKVTNVSYMFMNCKCLSYYCVNIDKNYDSNGILLGYNDITTYLVPRTLFKYASSVTNLTSMFEGNIFNYSNSLYNVLPASSLTCTNMFKNCQWTNTQGSDINNDSSARFVIDYPLFKITPADISFMFGQDYENMSNTKDDYGCCISNYLPRLFLLIGNSEGVNITGVTSFNIKPKHVFAGYIVNTFKYVIAPAMNNSYTTNCIPTDPTKDTQDKTVYNANWHYIDVTSSYGSTTYKYTKYPLE